VQEPVLGSADNVGISQFHAGTLRASVGKVNQFCGAY